MIAEAVPSTGWAYGVPAKRLACSSSLPSSSSLLERKSCNSAFRCCSRRRRKSSSRNPGASNCGSTMSRNRSAVSQWLTAVNTVISLSTRAVNDPAIGYSARLISSIRIRELPPSAIIAAESAARPGRSAGSCADPTENRNFQRSKGDAVRCSTTPNDELLCTELGAGNSRPSASPAGSDSWDRLVNTSRSPVRYVSAAL